MAGDAKDLIGQAHQKLERALGRVSSSYPFYGWVISTWEQRASFALQTLAVTPRDQGIRLLYNPVFVCACPVAQLVGVLHHEVLHVVLRHLQLDRSIYTDQWAFDMATEVTVNEWINEPLPAEPILLSHFPELPPNEDVCIRYERLLEMKPDLEKNPNRNPHQLAPPGTYASHPSSHVFSDNQLREGLPQLIDDHSLWQHPDTPIHPLTVEMAASSVASGMTKEQWNALPAAVRAQVNAMLSGYYPVSSTESLALVTPTKIDWKKLFSRHAKQVLEARPVFTRAPRRFPDLLGVVPGRLNRPARPRVMSVIDTSSSMSAATLEAISAQIESMARSADVCVVECDATVRAVYRYEGRIRQVKGRGNTDFRPPLEKDFIRDQRPDVVVYFTDGGGKAPTRSPSVPVIWCLTQFGKKPARWGSEVRLVAS